MDARTGRFESLDSLRGVAACLVALGHLGTTTPFTSSLFFANTTFLVDFFFVLSGFVIAWNYAHRLTTLTDLRDFADRPVVPTARRNAGSIRVGRCVPVLLLPVPSGVGTLYRPP